VDIKSSCLHVDDPLPPAPVEHRVNFQRLLTPICHLLTLVNGKCNTGVFNPEAETLRFTSLIRDAIGVLFAEHETI
jgi:hypothetical protein